MSGFESKVTGPFILKLFSDPYIRFLCMHVLKYVQVQVPTNHHSPPTRSQQSSSSKNLRPVGVRSNKQGKPHDGVGNLLSAFRIAQFAPAGTLSTTDSVS